MSIIFFDILKELSETYWMFRKYYMNQLLIFLLCGLSLVFDYIKSSMCACVANGVVPDICPLPLTYEKELHF